VKICDICTKMREEVTVFPGDGQGPIQICPECMEDRGPCPGCDVVQSGTRRKSQFDRRAWICAACEDLETLLVFRKKVLLTAVGKRNLSSQGLA
jgi:hypothetical protein